ncbi:MAG: hypothetical protein IJS15_15880 [Victivallales bacterium]|nr:hypothetical protein [Victivallales bacterium]
MAVASLAERITPSTLPPSAFADTEASTNIAIAVQDASRSFSVSLSLDAAVSNCVEVAVGHDAAPLDGGLSTADVRKIVTLRLGIRPNDSIREIRLLDGGVSILPNPLGMALPSAVSWNMLRVTTRGCAPPQESLEVRSSPDGTQLIMR